jgi:ribosomal protein S18 acetylase RimI-like enzyme
MQPVENSYSLPLKKEGLTLYRGWNDDVARQLVERSKEPEIKKFTHRDVSERFVDAQSADNWYRAKDHVVYALFQGDDLAGVAWFARTERPELGADYTFAIRMYESQRGRGLAGALIESAHADLAAYKNYPGAFWLESDQSNERAVHFYQKHAYHPLGVKDGRVLMVRKGGSQE